MEDLLTLFVLLLILGMTVGLPVIVWASNRGYARKATVEKYERENAQLKAEKDELGQLVIATLVTVVKHNHEGPMLATKVLNVLSSSELVQEIERKEIGA